MIVSGVCTAALQPHIEDVANTNTPLNTAVVLCTSGVCIVLPPGRTYVYPRSFSDTRDPLNLTSGSSSSLSCFGFLWNRPLNMAPLLSACLSVQWCFCFVDLLWNLKVFGLCDLLIVALVIPYLFLIYLLSSSASVAKDAPRPYSQVVHQQLSQQLWQHLLRTGLQSQEISVQFKCIYVPGGRNKV